MSASRGGERAVADRERDGRGIRQIFDLNVRGTLVLGAEGTPAVRDGGSIVLNGSIASRTGMPGLGV